MRRLVLLGAPGTKRAVYLMKAADQVGIPIEIWDWRECSGDWRRAFEEKGLKAAELFLKIDPPPWDSCCLEELNGLALGYEKDLEELARLGEEERISFFNHPHKVKCLLNKRECKSHLMKSGAAVTETLVEKVSSAEELLEIMERKHMSQVFLKPVRGSGAAGVAAFRHQKKTGQMVLYTCGLEDPRTGRLVNTKRLRRFADKREIMSFLGRLLRLDCMAERWYAKAEHQGFSYDLRAVVQGGQVDFMLARLSRGPVTNLQLNNHPLELSELGLPLSVREQAQELCRKAVGCFEGLGCAGVDILLEKGSLRPRVIEMNGQGDLIYQDIYNENKIYRRQAEMMKEWLYGNG